jgi:CubicO group peptidase (beta-lactamase class C family)
MLHRRRAHLPGTIAAGLLTIFMPLPATRAGTSASDALTGRVAAVVEEVRDEAGVPALALAVVADGKVVAELASGLADREAGVPATAETVFRAASVSKLLTAALVMQQVEKGLLDLDAPANEHLEPALRIRDANGREVPATLRQLLSHTSGLPVARSGIRFDPDDPPRSMQEYLTERLRVIHPPGERVIYANDAFALAGLLAARAAGRDFETLAQESLLQPLGMSSSSFAPGPGLRERLAAAYGSVRGGDDRTRPADLRAIAPAGGLVTTAGDLARFALLILGEGAIDERRLLEAGSVREMLRLQARAHPNQQEGFGLGFAVREGPGRRVVWWDGDLPGAASRLALLPDAGVGVAILSNLADHRPRVALSRRVFGLLLGPETLPPAGPDVARFEPWTGTYRPIDMLDPETPLLELLFNVQVVLGDDSLEMRVPLLGETARLRPLGPQTLRVDGGVFDGATVLFEGDRLYAHMMVARRVAPWETANAFFAYAGTLALGIVAVPAILIVKRLRRSRRTAPSG